LVAGGHIPATATATARGRNGETYVVAARARFLVLYTVSGAEVTEQVLAGYAENPRAAVDADGFLHILYFSMDQSRLIYLTNRSGSWVSEAVVALAWSEDHDLALDASGAVHVCFDLSSGLTHGVRTDNGWTFENVSDRTLGYCRIAVGAQGYVHIVGSDVTDNYAPIAVYYTNWPEPWTRVEVVRLPHAFLSDGYFLNFGIAVGADGTAQFAYEYYIVGLEVVDYYVGHAGFVNGHIVRQSANAESSTDSVALVLDDNDRGHVFFGGHALRDWTNAGGSWTANTLAATAATSVSAALDSSGAFQVSYVDAGQAALQLGQEADAAWSSQTLVVSPDDGRANSLALDAAGYAYLAYFDYTHGQYLLADNATGPWRSEAISAAEPGYDPDYAAVFVAVEPSGRAHVAFYDYPNGDSQYAVREDSGWVFETVFPANASVSGLSLDVDGFVHLTYNTGDAIFYATNRSGAWKSERIAVLYDRASLAVDSADAAHLVYRTDQADALHYATNASGDWVYENPSTGGNTSVILSTAIVVDADQNPHILITSQEETPGVNIIRHIWKSGGQWQNEIVYSVAIDNDTFIGQGSLALDGDGFGHVAYCGDCWMYSKLEYATNRAGAWTSAPLDPYGGTVDETIANDIALDGAGNVHISYNIAGALWHAVFPVE
jgi:hypothetical protein